VFRPFCILLVEDNPADVRLLQEAFRESGEQHELHIASDGQDALDFLFRRNEHGDKPRPDLILLDLNLPKIDGHHVLNMIKNDPKLRSVPVLMLTHSDSISDIQRAYENHANAYLKKPSDLMEYFDVVRHIGQFWFQTVRLVKTVPSHIT
jgi:CheY-like chemotaxis protein